MNRKAILSLSLSLFFFDTFIAAGLYLGEILSTSDSSLLLLLSAMSMNALLILSLILGRKIFEFYSVCYLLIYETGAILLTGNSLLSLLLLPSVVAGLYGLHALSLRSKVSRGVSFLAVLLFMFFISKTILLVNQPVPSPLTFELLSDRMAAIGLATPFTEYAGLFVSTRYADVILSPFQFFLYLFISSLLVENYHLIIPFLSKKGRGGVVSAGYGVLSALGCQCESAIGAFPAASLLILNVLLLPFFALSIVLIAMTYLLITRYYSVNNIPSIVLRAPGNKELLLLAAFVILTQLVEVFGAAFRLQSNPIFFFGTMMLMIFDGFALYYIIHRLSNGIKIGMKTSALLFPIAVAMATIWFIPSVTAQAVRDPLIFSIMSYVSLISGFIISAINYSRRSIAGITFLEGYAVILGIVPIVLFYVSFYLENRLWSFWTLSQQGEASIALWMIMIPSMWVVTQSSLVHSMVTGSVGAMRSAGKA
ncbi:MAG: hypothetical protein ACP5UO_05955 [Thermoplasmata archaeon]